MKKEKAFAISELLGSMIIFGTVGIFRRYIPYSSGLIAMARGLVGVLFLLLLLLIKKRRVSFASVKKNLPILLISGALIGFNWILLFEAYEYTSVATATLCYYMAPVFVIAVSPIFLGERMTLKKTVAALVALFGMVLVSDILSVGVGGLKEIRGILLGLGAAILYASVIVLNKRLKDISAYDRTILQLGAAFAVLLPYVLITEKVTEIKLTLTPVLLLLLVGVVHTGISYALYFSSMEKLPAQTVAIFSYLDPILAVLLSAVILHEKMSILGAIGAVLILGATLICELPSRKNNPL